MSTTSRVSTPEAGGRQALIDALVAAIEEDGLAGVSLRAVTRRAHVSHAAPAHHFGDKAGLFSAVALEGFARLEAALTAAIEAARPKGPTGQLQALAVAYVTFAHEHRAHFEVMFRPELVRPADPDLERAATATYDLLRDTMRAARDEGFGRGLDVDELALASWAFVHGIVQLTVYGVMGRRGFTTEAAVELTGTMTRLMSEMFEQVGER